MKQINIKAEWLTAARKTLEIEAQAIQSAIERIDGNLTDAVDLILKHPGKIVVSGVGKSGHIGRKIVATLCSTGTPTVFLHPSEAIHGDLGIYSPGDPTILISKSGATEEIIRLIPILRNFNSPLIAIVGNITSPLARSVDILFDATVKIEADPLSIVPTASTTLTLAIGDALASAMMKARNFTQQDFARFHPGGQLGKNIRLTTGDLMHPRTGVARVSLQTSMKEVIIAMTEHPLGAACVVDSNNQLLGIITDGDIRRTFQKYDDIQHITAENMMTTRPIQIYPELTLTEAIRLMEDRTSQISVLPVVDNTTKQLIGLLRLHDIYQKDIV